VLCTSVVSWVEAGLRKATIGSLGGGLGTEAALGIEPVTSSLVLNGFRDDAQCFRELYNAQSVEALKGPSAITFGRNAVTRTVERLRRLSRPLSRGGRCRQ
jgi:outer membrane receptor for monomeric catechols